MPKTEQKIIIKASDRTKQAFRSVKNGLTSMTKAIFSFKGALVLAAGAAGLGLLINKSLQAIDTLGKLSKTYGIATEDLATFKVAAEIGGSSLDTFARASRNVAKNVFDFVIRGAGEASDAFDALGITVDDLRPIMNDNVALMGLIGDRMNQMEDGAVKTAIAVKILGGRAVELLPALAGGTEQFKKFREETELWGLALSNEAVKGVEDANDAMTRIGFIVEGLTKQVTAGLAPGIELAATAFKDWAISAVQAKGGMEALGKTIAFNVVDALESVALGSIQVINQFIKLKTSVQNATSYLMENSVILNVISFTLGRVAMGWREIFKLIDDNAKAAVGAVETHLIDPSKVIAVFADLKRAIIEVKPEVQELAKVTSSVFAPVSDGSKQAEKALKEFENATKKAREEAERLRQAIMDEGLALSKSLRTELEVYNDTLQRNDELLQAGAISAIDWARANDDAREALEDVNDAGEEANKIAQELGLTFTSAFEDAVIKGESFRDVLQGIWEDIQRIILRKTITEPLAEFIGSIDFGSIFGGTKAHGGPVSVGTPYLVGERGPELFVPGANGAIVQNGNFGGSNVNIVVNNNASSATARAVDNGFINGQQQIEIIVKDAFEANLSSGVHDKSFRQVFNLGRVGVRS